MSLPTGSLTTGPRPLVFNAFLTNTVSHIHHGMWRHPDSRQADYTDLNLWIDLVRTLERGHFDAIFFADTLGPMDITRAAGSPRSGRVCKSRPEIPWC